MEADAYDRHYLNCPTGKPDIYIKRIEPEMRDEFLKLPTNTAETSIPCPKCDNHMIRIGKNCLFCPSCNIYYVPSEDEIYSSINDIFKQRGPSTEEISDIIKGLDEVLRKNCGFNGLNPVQRKALEEAIEKIIHGNKKGIVALPTGTGKTVLAACLLRWLLARSGDLKNARVVFLAPSLVILEQIATPMDIIGESTSDFCRIFEDLPVKVHPLTYLEGDSVRSEALLEYIKPSPSSIVRVVATTPHLISFIRKHKWEELLKNIDNIKVLIMDEVHHTYNGKEMAKVMKELIDKVEYVIGLSATPTKEAVENVGNILTSCSIEEAMRQGVLVGQIDFRIYDTEIIKNVEEPCDEWKVFIRKRAEEYAKKIVEIIDDIKRTVGADRVPKTAIACPNVREADALSEILKEELGADDVLKIHYKEEERGVLEDFRRRKSGVLVSVNMINIGFNDRNLEALVIARPIKNPLSYVQLVGRVLRTPSKDGEEWNIKSQLGRAVVVDLTRSLYRLSKTESSQAFFEIARKVLEMLKVLRRSEEEKEFKKGLEGKEFENDLKGYLEPSEKIREISADVYVRHLESSIISPEKPEDKRPLKKRRLMRKSGRKSRRKRKSREKAERRCPHCHQRFSPTIREGEMVCPKCGYVFGT